MTHEWNFAGSDVIARKTDVMKSRTTFGRSVSIHSKNRYVAWRTCKNRANALAARGNLAASILAVATEQVSKKDARAAREGQYDD